MTTSDEVAAALGRPETHPSRPARVDVHETHISRVFVAGDRAYKLKKPLVLPFLDYGTAERRRVMCEEEVRLNRRLAPEIYLGVRAVVPAAGGGFALGDADAPGAVEHVVEMRRFDEGDTLAARVRAGTATREDLAAVARRLAAFHEDAPAVPPGARPAVTVERRLAVNAAELIGLVEHGAALDRIVALERFAHAYLAAHRGTFEQRARDGRIRELHGDLRAEHVLPGDPVQVVDCVEFDPGLRELDVADELAFLVMDLTRLGAEHLTAPLVGAYRAAGGDPGPDGLIAFFAAYRALVRAKVALVRAAQLPPSATAHGDASAEARDLVALAERFAWRARRPLAVVVCGVPASGKSTLAAALAERSGLPPLSSDVTRKALAGLAATERAAPERYAAAVSAQTYAELGRRAAAAVVAGGGVIVDGTFRRRPDRDAFAAAFGAAAPLLFVECRVPAAELERRARTRDAGPAGPSDADLAVVLRERTHWDALDEVPAEAHVVLRADRAPGELVAELTAVLDERM